MPKSQAKLLSGYALREAGWDALVKKIGLVNATRFMLQYEPGYGDYTKLKKTLFDGKSVTDIVNDMKDTGLTR
jgi:hypothetical protein